MLTGIKHNGDINVFYKNALQRALDELEWASRTEDESTSIRFGKWVGIGAARQIIQEFGEKIKARYEDELLDNSEDHY